MGPCALRGGDAVPAPRGRGVATLERWQPLNLSTDPHEAEYRGDPAELLDAFGELLEALRRPEWHRQAACRAHPDLTWYSRGRLRVAAAKAVCAGCPVRGECAAAADDHGIWAGLDEVERRQRPASNDAA